MIENDLRLATLARLCRAQWRDNGLCRRIWRRIRPWALVIAAVLTMQSGVGVIVALSGAGIGAGAWTSPAFLASIAASCFFGLLSIAFWIGAPLWYAHWSHRVTWTDDEQLRAAPMPVRDRFLGIAVPGMMGLAVAHLPTVLVAPVAMYYTFGGALAFLPSSPVVGVLMAIASATMAFTGLASSILMLPTLMLRFLLLDSRTGQANGRRWLSVAWPFVAIVAIGMAWGIVRQVPMTVAMFLVGPGPAYAVPAWIALCAFQTVGDVATIWAYFAAMRAFWRRDIPLARTALFVVRE